MAGDQVHFWARMLQMLWLKGAPWRGELCGGWRYSVDVDAGRPRLLLRLHIGHGQKIRQ